MGANWDILNHEFDSLLENLSNEDWKKWAIDREVKKLLRRELLSIKAKIQSIKLKLDKLNRSCDIDVELEIQFDIHPVVVLDFNTKRKIIFSSSPDYNPPIAA